MDRNYWDSLAKNYEDELLEIAREDGAGTLEAEIAALASDRLISADLGCGPGSLLPILSKGFREVVAVDYAEELLEVARRRHGADNVTYRCHDLSEGEPLALAVDVVCCVNALIDPSRRKRERMLEAVAGATRTGGAVLMVVPAFESVFHVYHTLLRCRDREGAEGGLSEREAERGLLGEMESFSGGIIRVGGIPTKYWMREEILTSLAEHGLEARRVRKIEYSWEQEIEEAPDWLGAPFPWDWLVVAEKKK